MNRHQHFPTHVLAVYMLLLASGSASAWEPTSQELQSAIKAGDFSAYFAKISTWLDQKTSAEPNQVSLAAMTSLIEDPAFRKTLDQRQFLAKHGVDKVSVFAKDKANHEFLAWVLGDAEIMDLYLQGAAPMRDRHREENAYTIDIGALQRWRQLYADHPDSRKGALLKLAMATALWPPNRKSYPGGLPVDWLSRYQHYQAAYKNKELFPSFDDLLVWDHGKIIDSWASDEDLAWGREMVRTWRPDLLEKEQIPLIVSEVWRRFSPFPFSEGFRTVLAGGGKCGPRAFFGCFICEAFGIPAIGIGQPGHACFAAKVAHPELDPQPGSVWKIYQGRGWQVSDCGDAMYGPEFLAETAKRYSVPEFSQVEHLRWLAPALKSPQRSEAVLQMARNIWRDMPVVDHEAQVVNELFAQAPFDSDPDEMQPLKAFEVPNDIGENYIARIRAFVQPPQTGEYQFRIASDDHSELLLSTDDNPANKRHVAHVWGWSAPNQFTAKASQTSKAVRLEAGKRYYIEARHRELDGPDHCSVAWSGPGVSEGVIPAKFLAPFPAKSGGKLVREVWLNWSPPASETETTTPQPEPAIEIPPGVIHIEAEAFAKASAVNVFNCYLGGQQLNFPTRGPNWGAAPHVEYTVEAPQAGVYSLTMRVAVANKEQTITVAGGGEPVTVPLPWTRGLWGTTDPVDIRFEKGKQTLTLTRPDSHRGVALRWLELKHKN